MHGRTLTRALVGLGAVLLMMGGSADASVRSDDPRRDALLRQRRLLDEQETRLAESQLRHFIQQAWHLVEPGTPFVPNWHIDAIADHLQAVTEGHLRFLIINVPPRNSKSIITSVIWPAWEWVRNPAIRQIYTSHNAQLATKHAVDTRTIILSRWFKRRWGHKFALTSDMNVKSFFANNHRGFRMATGFGAGSTGHGGNRLVVDDPIDRKHADNTSALAAVNDAWDKNVSALVNDPMTDARVINMQRVSDGDLCAHVRDRYPWTWLTLPAVYEPKTRCRVFLNGKLFFEDPRTEAGQLLNEKRFGPEVIAAERMKGAHIFNAQQQQNPTPLEGIVFKAQFWKYYEPAEIAKPSEFFQEEIQSWDCAFKDKEGSDRVSGLCIGRRFSDFYLIDRDNAVKSFTDTCKAVRAMTERHPRAQVKLVEDKANGTAVIDTLRTEVGGLVGVEPQGGKLARAMACQPFHEAGNFYVPNPYDATGSVRPDRVWVTEFLAELGAFPRGKHDDDVDAWTQAILRFRGADTAFLRYLEQLAAEKARQEDQAKRQGGMA